MINKELIRRQARWTKKLSEYNFKIMYQSEIKNAKIDVLIYKVNDFLITVDNDKFKYQHQTILISFRLKIHNMKVDEKVSIYERIQTANKVDEKCECCKIIMRQLPANAFNTRT